MTSAKDALNLLHNKLLSHPRSPIPDTTLKESTPRNLPQDFEGLSSKVQAHNHTYEQNVYIKSKKTPCFERR